jgi:hypothetical protein
MIGHGEDDKRDGAGTISVQGWTLSPGRSLAGGTRSGQSFKEVR